MLDRAVAEARPGTLNSQSRLIDAEWAMVEEEEFVKDIRQSPGEGLSRALEWIQTDLRPPKRKGRVRAFRPGEAVNDQQEVVSELLAIHAEREDARLGFGIADFRQSILGDQLLTLEDVHAWIEMQADREGRPASDRLRLLSYRRYLTHKRPRLRKDGRILLTQQYEAEPWARYVQTVAGGVLDGLRGICERLSQHYGWHPTQAIAFVFTRAVPESPVLQWRINSNVSLPCRTRVVLSIDPTCTPEEVARTYADVRQTTFGRLRRLGKRHASLALFAARSIDRRGPFLKQAGQQHLDAWNLACRQRRQPKWQYRQLSVFDRDCRAAVDRLFHLGKWGRQNVSKLESSLYTSDADYRRMRDEGWIVDKNRTRRKVTKAAVQAARARMLGRRAD